jgi:oligoendopeptidase F
VNDMPIKKREDIEEKYKWNLQDMYETLEKWEDDYKQAEKLIDEAAIYKGKLKDSAGNLYNYLELTIKISNIFERLANYASRLEDQNTKNTKSQALRQRLSPLSLKYREKLSFFNNELMEIDADVLESFYKEEAKLGFYKKHIDEILRNKAHILSKEKEEVLAQTSELYSASETFNKLNNADITFEPVIDKDGNELVLTNSNYSTYISSSDREIREQAFKNLYKTYDGLKNTIASTYLGNLKKDKFYSKIRNYGSTLDSHLFSDNIPKSVYENLINTVKKNIEPMEKYISLRKKILGLDEVHMYDLYAPIVKDSEKEISYEEAYETMKKGLAPLGEEYVSILEEARVNRWIDVYENEGKRSGAYSSGPYGVHPYVLLNHKDDVDSMFTLAHEMGHALHSYYSNQANPYLYADYTIFVAEVASTVNEVLLMKYLLNNTNDRLLKLSLVNEFLDKFKGTLYRQTMFAEFEKITHDKVEASEPLTVDDFNEIYLQLNKDYYGEELIHDDEIKLEWARIPHFYNAFYVYKYATGFSAAIAIAERILNEGKPAVDDYLKFLKSGGTDYPIEELKIAGVDMSSPVPIENALKLFKELVDELENLSNE